MKSGATKADMLREIDQLRAERSAAYQQRNETFAELAKAREELETAETKGEKSRFARKWHKKLVEALGLDEDTAWEDIEAAAAQAHEELELLGESSLTASDVEKIGELFEGLGFSPAALNYALGSIDPVAALKNWS